MEYNSDADAEISEVEVASKRKNKKRRQKSDATCNIAVNESCPHVNIWAKDGQEKLSCRIIKPAAPPPLPPSHSQQEILQGGEEKMQP